MGGLSWGCCPGGECPGGDCRDDTGLYIVPSKFVVRKCKRIPPHLNSVSARSCET